MKEKAILVCAAMGSLPLVAFREALADVPPVGIFDPEAIREAFDGDLTQLRDLLQGAIKSALELSGEDDWWPYIQALFDDFVVVEAKDGKYLRYDYKVDGTSVTLEPPVEVIRQFVPAETAPALREAQSGLFLESKDDIGTYRIRIIRAGLSGNKNYYPDAVLREAVDLFEGVRVFVKSDAEHLSGGGKDIRNLIGALKNVAFVEGKNTDEGELQADLVLIEPEGTIAVQLKEAWNRELTDLFGFSIDSRGTVRKRTIGTTAVREAQKIVTVSSVDLIVEPGAGGGIINLIEAKGDPLMDREELIALLEAAGRLNGKNPEKMTDAELTELFREALDSGQPNPSTPPAADGQGDANAAIRLFEARQDARDLINASTLPEIAKTRLTTHFREATDFTDQDVRTAIQAEADYLATFSESGAVTGLGETPRFEMGQAQFEKYEDMLDAFFDPSNSNHRHARSFKECYIALTGDTHVTGRARDCDDAVMREAMNSTSLSEVLGDGIHRRLIADYNLPNQYDVWRPLVGTPVPINDFRTQERTRYGGYGDIPIVNESGAYGALTSPSDEKADYAVKKRGGTEKITLEMIKNDDVGVIRQIPIKMSRAAKRTLSKFVLDFIKDNPNYLDGVALFHASHGNLGTAALDKASLAAGRLAMLKQQEMGSNEPLGIGPKYLWVAPDLEENAVDLFRRNTENDRTFQQGLSLEVMPVWYWTDANDWALTADPADAPFIELGFLDGNEEPDLFIQDSPTVGSVFSNDEITYKLLHVYGGNALDFRSAYKAVVA